MTPEELADHWDNEASIACDSAENTRSLDHYVREHTRAAQMRQCAMQLRLVLGNARLMAAERAATEVRTCYCGTTATVVPGVFPHRDCDGSVAAGTGPSAQEADEYCAVHDQRLKGCREPERCREQMRGWGLYSDPAASGTEHATGTAQHTVPVSPRLPLPGESREAYEAYLDTLFAPVRAEMDRLRAAASGTEGAGE